MRHDRDAPLAQPQQRLGDVAGTDVLGDDLDPVDTAPDPAMRSTASAISGRQPIPVPNCAICSIVPSSVTSATAAPGLRLVEPRLLTADLCSGVTESWPRRPGPNPVEGTFRATFELSVRAFYWTCGCPWSLLISSGSGRPVGTCPDWKGDGVDFTSGLVDGSAGGAAGGS